jgi:RNA polymerase sigma-32 factor
MIAESASFASYRAEVARRPRLTREDEEDLVLAHRAGDRRASRVLVEGCLGTVIAVALEYRRCGLPVEDLVQEGNLGLLKAIDRYDPGRGARLAGYAEYWIRSEIREYVARYYRIARLGASKAERRALWLFRRTGEERPEALAALSGLSVERAAELLPLLSSRDASLSPAGDGGPSLVDRLADPAASAESALGHLEERARLQDALTRILSELPARDRDIVRRRLLADEPETLEQLGAAWGVSKERVRQLEESVKSRMRVRLRAFGGGDGGRSAMERTAPHRARAPHRDA